MVTYNAVVCFNIERPTYVVGLKHLHAVRWLCRCVMCSLRYVIGLRLHMREHHLKHLYVIKVVAEASHRRKMGTLLLAEPRECRAYFDKQGTLFRQARQLPSSYQAL